MNSSRSQAEPVALGAMSLSGLLGWPGLCSQGPGVCTLPTNMSRCKLEEALGLEAISPQCWRFISWPRALLVAGGGL